MIETGGRMGRGRAIDRCSQIAFEVGLGIYTSIFIGMKKNRTAVVYCSVFLHYVDSISDADFLITVM